MIFMKKILSLIFVVLFTISVFVGCSSNTETENSNIIRIGGLKGLTSIGMVKLLDDSANGLTENNYEFTLAGSADELTPKILKGELDIIAAPINLAAVLSAKSNGAVQVLGINVLGVLYIVEKGEITVNSLEDLKGKTIYATGKGSTPEVSLTYLLEQKGIDINNDVSVIWKSEPSEVVAQMAADESAIAMLPQPYVTVAENQLENLNVVLDLNEEWNKLDNGTEMITAVIIVRKDFAEKNPELIDSFMNEYKSSTEYVTENVEEAAALTEKFDIIKAAVAKKAIPDCNIVFITGEEAKEEATAFFEILYNYNPASVGGTLPSEGLFLVK